MRNIDKYEKEIKERLKGYDRGVAVDIDTKQLKKCGDINCVNCLRHNTECDENDIIRWLLEEYKEPPILDEVEKSYLEYVLRPLKNQVKTIRKNHVQSRNNNYKSIEYIRVLLSSPLTINGEETLIFPGFIANTMYKGMDVNKEYTLKELGLFKGE